MKDHLKAKHGVLTINSKIREFELIYGKMAELKDNIRMNNKIAHEELCYKGYSYEDDDNCGEVNNGENQEDI